MEISQVNIRKAIDDLFDTSVARLKENIINVFIPFGGIAELPSQQFHTYAFTDELGELVEYLQEFTLILNQFNNDPKQKTRIFVQMYCRIMENDFQYLIIYNLLRLLNDLIPDWEFKTTRNSKIFYCKNPASKIDEISAYCKSHKLIIGAVLKNLFKADLRNSFYHSQYTLSPDGSFVNTRFYSPTFTIKPAKKVFKHNEIVSLWEGAEYFFDHFFKRYYNEMKKFKDGKDYVLSDGRIISWGLKTNSWIVSKS